MGQTSSSWCGARERDPLRSCEIKPSETISVNFVGLSGGGDASKAGILPSSKAMRAALKARNREVSAADADARWKATRDDWERQVREALDAQAATKENQAPSAAGTLLVDMAGDAACGGKVLSERSPPLTALEDPREEERRLALAEIKREAVEADERLAALAMIQQEVREKEGKDEDVKRDQDELEEERQARALARAADELEAHWQALQRNSKLEACDEQAERSEEQHEEELFMEAPAPVPATPESTSSRAELAVASVALADAEAAEASPDATRTPQIVEEADSEDQQREVLRAFLAQNGFSKVNGKRRKRMRAAYPLHVAVEQADERIVRFLLEERADPSLRNSAGLTPLEVAQKCNSTGSHVAVVEVLAAVGTAAAASA
mmetsp:Transcript_71681/g.180892  ORF Transcript_71681/g.180892 Transcript_71681/m.180892 type:complete len:381 (-) Transcript_71681:185-1327(-)